MTRFFNILVLLVAFTSSASATSIFIDNVGGFNTAIAGLTFEGTEDFESSTLAANDISNLDDPLTANVANGVFSTGLTAGLGLTVQSNTLAGMPVNVSPRGINGLATASAGYLGTPTDQVSNSQNGDSIDMLFDLADTFAVSFNPLVFDSAATNGSGQFSIRVFDTLNTLIFSQNDISAAAFTDPTTHIGIVAMLGEDIGRINLFGTGSISGGSVIEFTGADNISIYTQASAPPPPPTIPEPGTLAIFGLGLAGLGLARRKKA